MFCEKCNSLVGKIEMFNYSYIRYTYVCKCGNTGTAELYRGRKPWRGHPRRTLYNEDNTYKCQACETPLFWVNEENVCNHAFDVVCKCGVEYDLIFHSKWKNLVAGVKESQK